MLDSRSLDGCAGCSGSGHTYDGPDAMFLGITEDSMGGLTGWTYGSQWDKIGIGGICIEGAAPAGTSFGFEKQGSTYAAWGGVTNAAKGNGITFGAITHHYPNWSLGISGDDDHDAPFAGIYIGEFIELCPLERSPNLGLTGCITTGELPCLPK